MSSPSQLIENDFIIARSRESCLVFILLGPLWCGWSAHFCLGGPCPPLFSWFCVIHHSGFPAASLMAPFQAVFVKSSSFLPTLEMLWFPSILRCSGILCLYCSLTETPNSRPVGCKLRCPCGQVMEINEDLGIKKKYHRNYTGVFKNWKEDVPWPSLRFHEGVKAILTSGSERSMCLTHRCWVRERPLLSGSGCQFCRPDPARSHTRAKNT